MGKNNIILIGMPSSGKSTVGKILSGLLKRELVDTDKLILEREKKSLRDIVNTEGLEKFLQIQEQILLGLDCDDYIIATGGGVVHNAVAMDYLKTLGRVVFLNADLSDLKERISPERRFARNSGQTFDDLYYERLPLYEKYSDLTIDCREKGVEDIANEIKSKIE